MAHRRRREIVASVIALANRHFTPDQIVICCDRPANIVGLILAAAERDLLLPVGYVRNRDTVVARWG